MLLYAKVQKLPPILVVEIIEAQQIRILQKSRIRNLNLLAKIYTYSNRFQSPYSAAVVLVTTETKYRSPQHNSKPRMIPQLASVQCTLVISAVFMLYISTDAFVIVPKHNHMAVSASSWKPNRYVLTNTCRFRLT